MIKSKDGSNFVIIEENKTEDEDEKGSSPRYKKNKLSEDMY